MLVVALSAPDTPVMVTMALVAGCAESLAVSVSMLLPVVGLVIQDAVTPSGRPDVTARFTLPVNPATSFTMIVSVLEDPTYICTEADEEVRLKPGALTCKARDAVAVMDPEAPVMVNMYDPRRAELLAVTVRTLLPVAGFEPKDAVTPLGRPETERFTFPVNPPAF